VFFVRYKLVPEGEGRELDMPAARCRQMIAYAVSKTNNADKEVWDIVDPAEHDEYRLVRGLLCVCVCVCVCVCICVCVCVCRAIYETNIILLHVCIYMYIGIYIYIHIYRIRRSGVHWR